MNADSRPVGLYRCDAVLYLVLYLVKRLDFPCGTPLAHNFRRLRV